MKEREGGEERGKKTKPKKSQRYKDKFILI